MINQITLLGRVGKDPEVRHLEGGSVVADVSLATSRRYKDRQGEQREETQWHKIVMWGKLAELAEQYVKKGDQISVIGEIRYEDWEKDGQSHRTAKITAEKMIFVSKANRESKPGQELPKQNGHPAQNEEATDDLPF